MIEYINQNSGVIVAVSTVTSVVITLVLVIVTSVYVYITHKILKESEKNRKSNFLPVVVILKNSDSKILVRNVGNGLAQDIESDSDLINCHIFSKMSFLCPHDDNDISDIIRDRDFEFLKRDRGHFNIFYKDIYGRKCLTKVKFTDDGDYDCIYLPPEEKINEK